MVNSYQQNETQNKTSFQLTPSSECIAWLTVFMTESVAIVMANFLAVFVFIKKRSPRKRGMYLVINLAVADKFVGGCTEITESVRVKISSSFWNNRGLPFFVDAYVANFFLAASLSNLTAISLERSHATFRPFRRRFINKWVFGFIITIT